MKNYVKNIFRDIYYPIKRMYDYIGYKSFVNKNVIHVKNTSDTIDYILKNSPSVSRFGDGEYRVMNNGGNGFQDYDELLGKRLIDVLNSKLDNHICCIPYAFTSVKHMTNDAKNFWYPFCSEYGDFIIEITDKSKIFYDTNFTRFYMDIEDKKSVSTTIIDLKKIWENRNICIIEGEYSRLGIGNDLFDNARNIKRIICPSKNAFSKYDQILESSLKLIDKDTLVLCALGMTATVLCFDLAKYGYQAIDIGHIDIEYSWYKMGVKRKTAVKGKAVNELNSNPTNVCSDLKYKNSIIAKIV